ncbi:hypothetical protein GBF38_013818 [Nibea albiflora]|uniref:Uncharacterized protein n=1 Tax=Nibea albiflora TaxID=240163 RepID=A0ACB7F9R9_NIBAL|nr:hypothetical protein GBF38_013818 [Nibea albiflora]
MQGEKGAVATVDMPSGLSDFNMLELDASPVLSREERLVLRSVGSHSASCSSAAIISGLYCNMELGRWNHCLPQGIGHWLTDVSPLLPLLDGNKCTLTMKTGAVGDAVDRLPQPEVQCQQSDRCKLFRM